MYLSYADTLAPVLVHPESITIGSPVTWNTAQSKFTNIEVPAGASLTINAPLAMAPGTYIIVRRGGILVVNSTITAGCGGMWGGVIVEGEGNMPQKDTTGQYSSAQGLMILNSSGVIEHALVGVGVHGEDPGKVDYGGGIVEIKGNIKNCTVATRFERYRYDSKPNASIIRGYFILDDNYRSTEEIKPVLLQIREINWLSITASWFYDNRTQGCIRRTSRADGIVARDASFYVSSSPFRNLDYAIYTDELSSSGYASYKVQNSLFFNCYTGVYSALPDPFSITGNTFSVGRPPMCPVISAKPDLRGVHLDGIELPEGIEISNNNFILGNYDSGDVPIGVDCSGTGNMENKIEKNTYTYLNFGNRANGNNGDFSGLRYECNHTDNLYADYIVEEGGSVRNVQSGIDPQFGNLTATGNTFNTNVTYRWFNDGASITCYYVAVPEQDLTINNTGGSTGIDPFPTNQPNLSCSSVVEPCPPPCEAERDEWEGRFFQEKSDWLAKKALYPTLADSTAQAALNKEIISHRSAMDIEGGKVIRDFALDSTGTKVDSVLVWIGNLARYGADLRLARHAFFTGDLTTYDQWLSDIPNRNVLSSEQSAELDDFTQVLAPLRPYVQTGKSLYTLPASLLDSLEYWASDCTDPGFIAKVILRRNGREPETICGETQSERPIVSQSNLTHTPNIRIYPNPNNGVFSVKVPQEDSGPVRLTLQTVDGRIVLKQTLAISGDIDAKHLSPGIYICHIFSNVGASFVTKLVISH